MKIEILLEALENSPSVTSKKAIDSRIRKAIISESILGLDMDTIVQDETLMFNSLLKLKHHVKEHNGCLQNTLRWYYKAINGKEFPTLATYEKTHSH